MSNGPTLIYHITHKDNLEEIMIQLTSGNLLEAQTEALVNTVNCVGVMGKGIALQFKQAFPENFRDYAQACKKGKVRIGKMFVYRTDSMFHQKSQKTPISSLKRFRNGAREKNLECSLSMSPRPLTDLKKKIG